jgi:hypothetical protein
MCKITWAYVEINLVYEEELSVSWYPVSIDCQTTILKVHTIEVSRYITQLSFVKFVQFLFENGGRNIVCQSRIRVNQVIIFMKNDFMFLSAEKPSDRGDMA